MEQGGGTVGRGEGGSDPVAQVGGSVGPDQLLTDRLHYS